MASLPPTLFSPHPPRSTKPSGLEDVASIHAGMTVQQGVKWIATRWLRIAAEAKQTLAGGQAEGAAVEAGAAAAAGAAAGAARCMCALCQAAGR